MRIAEFSDLPHSNEKKWHFFRRTNVSGQGVAPKIDRQDFLEDGWSEVNFETMAVMYCLNTGTSDSAQTAFFKL